MTLPLLLLLACTSPPPTGSGGRDGGDDTGDTGDAGVSDTGTAEVPEACGDAPWGTVEGTLFVDASAGGGGDGSAAAPFQTIGEAVAVAGGDDVVAIAAGTYKEKLALADRDLTLAGRCAELVMLQDPGTTGGGTGPIETVPAVTFNVGGGSGTLRMSGMRIAKGSGRAILVEGGRLELSETVLLRHDYLGIELTDAEAVLEDVVIGPPASNNAGTQLGLWITRSRVEARGLSVQRSAGTALWIEDESDVTLVDSEILDTVGVDEGAGLAMRIEHSRVSLQDVHISGAVDMGIGVREGASLDFDGLVIEGVTSSSLTHETQSPALFVATRVDPKTGEEGEPAEATGRGLEIRHADHAIWAGERGTITLSDVVVEDIGIETTVGGLLAVYGGRLEIDGAHIERTIGGAVLAYLGGEVVLRDAEILDVRPGGGALIDGATSEFLGVGAFAAGGRLELERVTIRGAIGSAVDMLDPGGLPPSVQLTDVTIEDVALPGGSRNAMGVLVREGAAEIAGLDVRGVAGPGLVAFSWADQPADVRCTDCRFADVDLAGVLVTGSSSGTTVTLQDSTISDVGLELASGLSAGVLITEGAGAPTVVVQDSHVGGAAHAALLVSGDADIQVHGGRLEGGEGALLHDVLAVHGNAVYATGTGAWDGASGLLLDGVDLVPGAGPTVLLHDASATLEGTAWEGGSLQQQRCGEGAWVDNAEEAPTFVACPAIELPVVDVAPRLVGQPPVDILF